jgi:hypothetical protein
MPVLLTHLRCYRLIISPNQERACNAQNVCCESMLLSNLYKVLIKELCVIHRMCGVKVSGYLICSEQLIRYRHLSKHRSIVGKCLQCVKPVSFFFVNS